VLVVDDHPDTAAFVGEYLEFHGARAVRAESAAMAREVLASEVRVDLVVTDYAMPDEDGLSLIARLRSMPGRETVAVVMISGHDTDGEIASAARALGADFVPKPLDLVDLSRALARALSGVEV
jgi:CheY-like chemotaxis protein